MANYLPVLLVSVTAGMPDDASFQPLPRGQVDYLSHDWQEEDVWRSWRNMTKQKNEIANGVRLENASWRTWWKQRNKLKTISPETLNWLKDSDVTWLYGPLHTAVDWEPPRPAKLPKDPNDRQVTNGKGVSCISSPSSSIALDMYPSTRAYGYQGTFQQAGQGSGMKPILKHRTISEMLTSALPPSPLFDNLASRNDDDADKEEEEHGADAGALDVEDEERRGRSAPGRPPLFHTKSDTNILRRFDKKMSPPRVAQATSLGIGLDDDYRHSRITSDKRSSASGNLVELARSASRSRSGSRTRYAWSDTNNSEDNSGPMSSARSGPSDTASSSRSDADLVSPLGANGTSSSRLPREKHISFNAIVEQCIAIDGDADQDTIIGSSNKRPSWVGKYDDGYDEDEEDGLYEDIRSCSDSDERDDDEDEVIEIKTPSRRSSESSLTGVRPTIEIPRDQPIAASQLAERLSSPQLNGEGRPRYRRSSTSKSARSLRSNESGSGSGGASQTRLSHAAEREHVTIAPMAPTILKAGGSEDNDEFALHYGGYGAGPSAARPNQPYSAARVYDDYDNERESDVAQLVFQSPGGSVYPWAEGDSNRVMQNYASASSSTSHSLHIPSSQTQSPSIPQAQYASAIVSSPSVNEAASDDGYEYFDGPDVNEDYIARVHRPKRTISSERGIEKRDKDEVVSSVLRYSNGGADSVDRRNSLSERNTISVPNNARDRTPSPDATPPCNPRITTLKSESYSRSSSSSSDRSTISSPPLSTPTLAIPTPGISPSHANPDIYRSPPESPVINGGLLSPPDMSPSRGRSICASPVLSYVPAGSPVDRSESRSDSRGRSRTRDSSQSTSDQEPIRGRSRSRSSASGANSPLSDSSSPNTRRSPLSSTGYGHSGREIRDGRGVRLYRKTSEDFIGQPETRGRYDRDREGRRISESLSPPVTGSLPEGPGTRGAAYSPGSYGVHASSGLYRSYSAKEFNSQSRADSNDAISDRTGSSEATRLNGYDQPRLSTSPSSGSLYGAVALSLPPSIPEADESQRSKPCTPVSEKSPVQPFPVTQSQHVDSVVETNQTKQIPVMETVEQRLTPAPQKSANVLTPPPPPPAPTSVTKERSIASMSLPSHRRSSSINMDNDVNSSGIVGKAAELVHSARGLLGAIWNGSN